MQQAMPSRLPGTEPAPGTARVLSIDALRGFDMFWLIGGQEVFLALAAATGLPLLPGIRAQLDHSEWIGFTFWDFIAPLFLFVAGLAIPYSISSRLSRGGTRRQIYTHVALRTLMLIGLGLVFNGILKLDFGDFRYTGVLQRIGLSYLGAALIYMTCGVRGQALWTASLLLGYWAVMALIPVPGIGSGVYTPEGNLAGYVDRLFLPGSFCCYGHGDNEGYLSTFPSVATVLLGVLCGHLLRSAGSPRSKRNRLALGGAASLLAGWLWSFLFPVITMLWTSSYVLWANGWCMLLFAVFYWAVDIRGWRRWTFPFVVIGTNAIAIYVIQSQFDFGHAAGVFTGGLARYAGVWREAVAQVATLAAKWLFLYFLWRQRIFLKV